MLDYERASDGSLKVGNTVQEGLTRINIGEILIDRGELAEAEQLLVETLPLWKASQHRLFLGATLLLLGRASLRAGRCDEALKRLDEARMHFVAVEAEDDIPAIDACIAECRIFMGDLDAAVELVEGMLKRTGSSNAVARMVPLLRRIRAHVLLEHGDLVGAQRELDASLAVARERRDLFEITRTLLSLIHVHRLKGVEAPVELLAESNALVDKLRIKVLPPVPMPLQ